MAGVIADVKVTQTYKNEGSRPIHAEYVFPGSTRAAVHGMRMKIGERVIVAKIKEREEASKEFAKAKAAGKSASLLEQDRPNVFRMKVANILPGDVIEVELRYTELLRPTDGIYAFVYPTVVGPRYASERHSAANPQDSWVQQPVSPSGQGADLRVRYERHALDGHRRAGAVLQVAQSGGAMGQESDSSR